MSKYTIKLNYWSRPSKEFVHMTYEEIEYLIRAEYSTDLLSVQITKEVE